MIQVLLEYQADVNARSAVGETLLIFGSQSRSNHPNLGPSLPEVALLLLEHGADVNALKKQRGEGWRCDQKIAVRKIR